jgi:hypothetical protein
VHLSQASASSQKRRPHARMLVPRPLSPRPGNLQCIWRWLQLDC